jgi:hypothetical protein
VHDTKESMMQRADEMLYAAKAARSTNRERRVSNSHYDVEASVMFEHPSELELES